MSSERWMDRPPNADDRWQIHGGLEYLTNLDQLLVRQRRHCSGNVYSVRNKFGETVYTAKQDVSCGCSNVLRIEAFDEYGRPTMEMYRPVVCRCSFQPIDVEVFSPPGRPIGIISHVLSWFSYKFYLKNAAGDIVLCIKGPRNTTGFYKDVDFKILGADEQTVVGVISKKWAGTYQEFFTSNDNFGVSFPVDLDVNMKAVVLAACFLIDFTYYGPNND